MILVDRECGLWVGNSEDGMFADLAINDITGVLNVAVDLQDSGGPARDIECMKVGLVDGPGNEVVTYCAAILAVSSLFRRHEAVLVYDHDGGRATAVSMMYLNLVRGKHRPDPVGWSWWMSWDERLAAIDAEVLTRLPKPHEAHVRAFGKVPFGILETIL